MFGFINQVGPLDWPLVMITTITAILFVKYAVILFGTKARTDLDISGLSLLGVLGLTLGSFSTLIGVYQGLQIFSQISNAQAAAGFSHALLALLFGLIIFILASVFWLVLRLRLKHLQSLST